jgi:hypothetical protein
MTVAVEVSFGGPLSSFHGTHTLTERESSEQDTSSSPQTALLSIYAALKLLWSNVMTEKHDV